MAKRTQGIADLPGHGIQILGPGVFVGIFGIELRHAVGRHQVDVGVRYVKTRNHQADSAAFGKPIEGGGDLVRHGKEMGGRRGGGGQVMPCTSVLRVYTSVPQSQRLHSIVYCRTAAARTLSRHELLQNEEQQCREHARDRHGDHPGGGHGDEVRAAHQAAALALFRGQHLALHGPQRP